MDVLNFLTTDRYILHFSVIARRFQGTKRAQWRQMLPFTAWEGHETGFLGGIRCYKHRVCDFTHHFNGRQSFFHPVYCVHGLTGTNQGALYN
ncbi:hypothetical protein [Aeromonas sp. MdU4]|uniref:hypothetical protein n=1 Tax=Aeromonas sp. MdU4 TaxID=3342819 RepID=UPI0035B84362